MKENKEKNAVGNNTAEKRGKSGKKKHSKEFDENIIRDTKTAAMRGRNGGIKSGIVKRAKKEAKESVRYMLDLAAKGILAENLEKLGLPKEERTNLAALNARIFAKALNGDLEAYLTLMKIAGYEPEENRKERESLSSDERRRLELEAKFKALGGEVEGSSVSVSLKDEDDNSDVVIYLPEIDGGDEPDGEEKTDE